MKAVLGYQQFIKCNFCMNWFQTKQECPTPHALNICEPCLERGRKTSCFKVLDHKNLRLYDVYFKKSGLGFMQTQCTQMTQMLDLTEKLEKQGDYNVSNLSGFFSELLDCEQQILNKLQPIRDLINKIYRNELTRIQEIWNNVTKQLQDIAEMILKYREQVTNILKSGSVKKFESILNSNQFGQIKEKIKQKLNLDLQSLKVKLRDNKKQFYECGFKLFDKRPPLNPLSNKQNIQKIPELPRDCYYPKKFIGKFKQLKDKAKGSQTVRVISDQNKQNICKSVKHSTLSLGVPNQYEYDNNKSPRNRFLKYIKQPDSARISKSKSILRKQKSIESTVSIDFNNTRQHTKSQISQWLKNKTPLQVTYKSNNQKSETCKIFPQKIMTQSIYQAIQTTFIGKNLMQLVAFRTDNLQFQCFMQMLQWHQQLQIIKFVKSGLTDEHLNIMLNYIRKYKSINTLVVTNNLLTDESLKMLLNFCQKQNNQLKSIYLGRNYIKIFRCKHILKSLEDLGVAVYL